MHAAADHVSRGQEILPLLCDPGICFAVGRRVTNDACAIHVVTPQH